MAVPDFLAQALENILLTQRTLLRRSAVLGGTAVLAGSGSEIRLNMVEAAAFEGEGLVAGYWISRGLRQLNHGYIQDGLVIRQTIDDSPLSSSL